MNIIENLKLKEVTIKNYKSSLNLVIFNGINYNDSQETIIEKFRNINKKVGTLKNMLNVVVVIRKELGLNYELLVEYRNEINAGEKKVLSSVNKKLISKKWVSKEEIKFFIEQLYLKKMYKNFIINKLLVLYSVRNQDLYLTVSNDNTITPDKNYLIVKDDHVRYIRNHYKTVKTYGPKEHIIKDKDLIKACKEFLGKDTHKEFLSSKFENIGPEIIRSTYKSLGEGSYFKLFVSEASSINEIKNYCDNRGTSFNTVYEFYNLNK